MKQNNQNTIIEIAIKEYISTSFSVPLEMSPQSMVSKNIGGDDNGIVLKNKQMGERFDQIENFGSDLL